MATAAHLELDPATTTGYHVPDIKSESSKIANRLLQQNHDNFHCFFNNDRFHNHIAHHLLSIWALGADEKAIQQAFDDNKGYQRSQYPVKNRVVEDLTDKKKFKEFLGKEERYHDYMIFFQNEITTRGWPEVLNEYLFSKDDVAEDLLVRLHAGFMHPLIHLGFGVEFEQPAIIAEAMAWTAVHEAGPTVFLQGAEKKADEDKGDKSLAEILTEIRSNDKLRSAPHLDDGNKLRDGVLARAANEMIHAASQWRVTPDNLEKKTAEMINASVYFAAASQRPPKEVKFDFFYMHSVNASVFFSSFLKQSWMSIENKCRLLEYKGRYDLANYVSRGSPVLDLDHIRKYKAKNPKDGWQEIFHRSDVMHDDGHAPKLIRALANGEQVCKPYEGDAAFPITNDMWMNLAHMAIDSVEAGGDKWIRNTGFDEAWKDVPDRDRARL